MSRLLPVRHPLLLPLGMAHPPTLPPGKRGASPEPTFPSSRMARKSRQQGSRFGSRSGEGRADGSLRVVYAASIRHCRSCPLREQCQWNGSTTAKPRQGSRLLHPLQVGSAPLLWRDWSRREHRRACMQFVRHQRLEMSLSPAASASPPIAEMILSRAQRAHSRLAWEERLARNVHPSTAGHVTIKLFGVPAAFAVWLGLATT